MIKISYAVARQSQVAEMAFCLVQVRHSNVLTEEFVLALIRPTDRRGRCGSHGQLSLFSVTAQDRIY